MQKPTLRIESLTRANNIYGTRGRMIRPRASTTALFSKTFIEISQVSESQKQAFVNANHYVRKPTPRNRTDTLA